MAEAVGMLVNDTSENSMADSLNLNIEELDDAEYDIPPVDCTPTLESILNNLEDQASLSEDEMSSSFVPATEGGFEGSETLSLGSLDSRSRSSSERRHEARGGSRWNNVNTEASHRTGSILRHVILKGISTQLTSASERVNAGLPTAMAATTMIAVGTSHGLVLVFDSAQTLRWCLGETAQDQGSVASLSFNHDCTRLLAGFARGHILMFDIVNGRLLRTMSDVHPPGTAVLHVKFTDSPTLALCSDSGGSVFELNFRRTMGIRGCDSKCLFSGSRGEVCCLEPLLLHQFNAHPLHGVVLVAMATLSKVIVVSIRPRMRVLFTQSLLHTSPATLPLLSWQFVIIQMADGARVIDPVLAFARESTIFFFQVSVIDGRSKIRFVPLQRLTVSYLLLSLHWLNTRTLATVDTMEQLHLLDVRTQEELEVLDLADVRLVYGTSHFKGLATGGNVSKAMALAGERACYNSIVSFGNQMLLLGTKTFHVLTIRAWNERLNHLIKQNRYLDALVLGMAFYQDKAKAVVGLKGPKHKRKEMACEKVLEILHTYIEEILEPGSGDVELCQEAVPACIEYCIELEVIDVLFGKLWDACIHHTAQACYLESLEPWLLSDRLPMVPPSITQQFVSHYERQGMLEALEACIVHLDVSSLDIDQVMRLCKTNGLYDATIHIYNRGLRDYVTPLEELMPILQAALATGKQLSDNHIALGNKLLVYISCCLAKLSGNVPSEDNQRVKHDVFKCLTCLHSKNASDFEHSYPYLRAFLHFDTREFLNVLALAFEEPEFTSELGLQQVQRLVDILLLVMVQQGDGFTPSQVGSLFTFLARQLAKPWCSLHVERQLFEQVVEFLTTDSCSTSTLGHHEERQQALLELMRAGGLAHYNQERLLQLADKAAFYRVCEFLYEQRQEYDRILHCYLKDPLRKPQVFSYLRNILLLYTSATDKAKVEAQILDNIQDLLDIDATKTAQILLIHVPQLIPKIVEKLQEESKVLFQFLQGLFDYRDSHSGLAQLKDESNFDPELVEQYIELLCEFSPEKVYPYIISSEGYRLDNALKITKRFSQVEATAFLLEKTGDFQGALSLMMEKLNGLLAEETTENIDTNELSSLSSKCVGLCQRGSAMLDEKSRQALWFPLLETLMHPQRREKPVHLSAVLKEMTQQLLMSMSAYVSLPAVIQVILMDPAYKGGKFGDIRELMIGMLSSSCYEETLLQATARLLSTDLHHQLAKLLAASNQGISPRSLFCAMCQNFLHNLRDDDHDIVFRCGHAYHASCLETPWKCCHCVATASTPTSPPIRPQSLPQSVVSPTHSAPASLVSQGLLQSQDFGLRLAPPPPPDLEGIF
ncbi:LOW QUALITY PROTEIN: vacuolar protein sorting-associated protein 8 homolog [Zootermopsis nevadensis]|uniref:LOW QUALITY PROTEIN: vacuolar protein sorting-associated protein 8 homolog n=1 Tax=Zootermopsis nevadensis TaxID=136037 RepID=UPI000B8ED4CD|nr:LOW QUALITY PROTEIN: vacuolar protein sorting-associated protein 8 homolog [Zootermopsis nevadensis]